MMFGIINSNQCHPSVHLMQEVATSLWLSGNLRQNQNSRLTKQTLFGLLIEVQLENAQVFFYFLFVLCSKNRKVIDYTINYVNENVQTVCVHVCIHHRYSRFFKYLLHANQFMGRIYIFSS